MISAGNEALVDLDAISLKQIRGIDDPEFRKQMFVAKLKPLKKQLKLKSYQSYLYHRLSEEGKTSEEKKLDCLATRTALAEEIDGCYSGIAQATESIAQRVKVTPAPNPMVIPASLVQATDAGAKPKVAKTGVNKKLRK